jgi:hypothetical protein
MNSYLAVTGDMNSFFLMFEFISGGVMCEVPSKIYHYCPDQLGCVC